MIKFFNKKNIGLLAVALFLLITPLSASAGVLECASAPLKCVSDTFEWITQQIGYIIAYVTAQLISLAAYFIQVLIGMSIDVMKTPVVQTGFKISLSFANLGFTLAVIFIAFITIFRLQGYETKKLLRNLIIAAVLINFSFTFAGLIMDGSHVFAKFFLNAIAGKDGNLENLTASIADSLNIQKIHNAVPPAGALGSTANAAMSYYKMLASIALTVFFNSIMVITFFTIAGLMVVRYIVISILLIVMPFAWLCWIFPNLAGNWKKWWDTFLKWNIFLPVLMFFIYLSVLVSSETGRFIEKSGGVGTATGQAAATFTIFGANIITAVVQAIVQVALLFGGMIIAQKMGIAGSDAIMKGANFVKTKIQGGVVGMAKMPYTASRRVVAPGAAPIKNLAGRLANGLNSARWIPGAGSAVVALNKFSSRKGEVEAHQKSQLADLTDDQFKQVARSGGRGKIEQTAILAEAIKRKKVGFLTEGLSDAGEKSPKKERLKMYAAAAKATQNEGLQKEVVAMDPMLAKEVLGKETSEFVRGVRPDKVAEWSPETLSNRDVALNLSPGAMAKIVADGTNMHIEKLQEALEKAMSEGRGYDPEVSKVLKESGENIRKATEAMKELNERGRETTDKKERDENRRKAGEQRTVLRELEKGRKEAMDKAHSDQKLAMRQLQTLQQKIGSPEKQKPPKTNP